MKTKLLHEHGSQEALLGLSLSYDSEPNIKVANQLAHKQGGHNKFLESIVVWLDITAPRYWWQEFDTYRIGITKQSGCFDDQTEILTECGWVFFSELNETIKVATVNLSNNEIEYHLPTGYVNEEYSGLMFNIESSKIDCLVTPNHSFYGRTNFYSPNIKKYTVSDMSKIYIPKKFRNNNVDVETFVLPEMINIWDTGCRICEKVWEEREISMDLWLKFLGIYISQGCVNLNCRNYNIQITHNVEDGTAELIDELLNDLGFNFSKLYEPNKHTYRWTISERRLYEYLLQFGKAHDKFLPGWFRDLSERQALILLSWLCKGDGTKHKEKWQNGDDFPYILYSTVSEQLADDVQELTILAGLWANKYIRSNESHSTGQVFTINFQSGDSISIDKHNISKAIYSGRIYCVETPNGTLISRRNGRVLMTGNSTMHTIMRRRLNLNDFEGGINPHILTILNEAIEKKDFGFIKRHLPESFLQRRIVCTNYKVLQNMFMQRNNHKLKEWRVFLYDVLKAVEHPEWLKQ